MPQDAMTDGKEGFLPCSPLCLLEVRGEFLLKNAGKLEKVDGEAKKKECIYTLCLCLPTAILLCPHKRSLCLQC